MPQFTPAQVGLAQAGDEAALACVLAHMMPMIRSSAAGCIGPGMELEDAVQEGIIGLFRALESYDVCRDASFETYAGACIQHAQQAAKRAACRKKHLPLNTSVPLEESTPAPGPEEQAIEQERYNSWKARMAARLSPLERQVLGLYLQGLSYAAIGVRLVRTTKSVENALGRARAKLRRNLPYPLRQKPLAFVYMPQ